MNLSFQFALICFGYLLILTFLTILLKYILFRRYRTHHNSREFRKSFSRWYTKEDRKSKKIRSRMIIYMRWNNILNVLFWIIVFIIFVAIIFGFLFYFNTIF